ncbi:MAG: hypothetical protein K0R18_1509 [Bacillales bacterium]|jgi:hypothetical protein|nr:hypothetical protein [Bacillales bacterium]
MKKIIFILVIALAVITGLGYQTKLAGKLPPEHGGYRVLPSIEIAGILPPEHGGYRVLPSVEIAGILPPEHGGRSIAFSESV